jgi:Uma2 family endonuclease
MVLKLQEPQVRRWTLDEYYELAEQGYFHDQRVMLIDGEIIQMAAQGHQHVKSVHRTVAVMQRILGTKHWIRSQAPLSVGRWSDPEPDVLVTVHPESYYTDHPDTGLLAVEVSDTTLSWDRRKAGLYAAAGIEDYWILNLQKRELEVHRGPVVDRKAKYGHRYGKPRVLREGESIAPLARPGASVKVADLLA